MRSLRAAAQALVWTFLIIAPASAAAGPWLDGWLHGTPARAYRPSVSNYVVVDPAPYAAVRRPTSRHPSQQPGATVTSNAPVLWREHDLPSAMYPYGWFGARSGKPDIRTRGSYSERYNDVVYPLHR